MKTVTFRFRKTGVNAHTAVGKFVFDSDTNAKKAAERMRKTFGFSNVRFRPLNSR